jgi:hypothetical protein
MCLFHLSGRISTHYLHTRSCTRSFLHESRRLLDSPWTMRSSKRSSRLLHSKYNCGLSTLIASSRIQLQLFMINPIGTCTMRRTYKVHGYATRYSSPGTSALLRYLTEARP